MEGPVEGALEYDELIKGLVSVGRLIPSIDALNGNAPLALIWAVLIVLESSLCFCSAVVQAVQSKCAICTGM